MDEFEHFIQLIEKADVAEVFYTPPPLNIEGIPEPEKKEYYFIEFNGAPEAHIFDEWLKEAYRNWEDTLYLTYLRLNLQDRADLLLKLEHRIRRVRSLIPSWEDGTKTLLSHEKLKFQNQIPKSDSVKDIIGSVCRLTYLDVQIYLHLQDRYVEKAEELISTLRAGSYVPQPKVSEASGSDSQKSRIRCFIVPHVDADKLLRVLVNHELIEDRPHLFTRYFVKDQMDASTNGLPRIKWFGDKGALIFLIRYIIPTKGNDKWKVADRIFDTNSLNEVPSELKDDSDSKPGLDIHKDFIPFYLKNPPKKYFGG